MYISEIVTYGLDKTDIENKYGDQLADIQKALEMLTSESIGKARPDRGPKTDDDDVTPWKMKSLWEDVIKELHWSESRTHVEGAEGRRFYMRLLGHISKNVSCTMATHRETLSRWLYTAAPIAYKNGVVEVPIVILPTNQTYKDFFGNRMMASRENFERVVSELEELSPLSHSHPFIIIGISPQKQLIHWKNIDSEKGIDREKVILNKCIEFPPEFRQAGLGILNYFGEVIREKYPEENAKIKIEQDGTTVRLIIEADDGSREIIEKALEEYELVVTGQQPPESIFDDRVKVLELKNELRITETRIESQRDIIEYQREDMKDLKQLFGNSLTSSPTLNLNVSPNINVSSTQSNTLSVVCGINEALNDIQYLIDEGEADSSMSRRLNDLYESIENVDDNGSSDEIKSSSGMSKLQKFLNDSLEVGTKANDFISKLSGGIETAKSLAKKYNSIAEWCGAPQVPSVFVE